MGDTPNPDPLVPPHTDPTFSGLSPMDKHRRMEAWRIATAEAVLAKTGQRRLPEWETGAKRWCTNCWEAFERVDSHGDCADCGEDVWWVTPPAPPTGGPVQSTDTGNAGPSKDHLDQGCSGMHPRQGLRCSRESDHGGVHVATGDRGEIYAVWTDDGRDA